MLDVDIKMSKEKDDVTLCFHDPGLMPQHSGEQTVLATAEAGTILLGG